MKKHLFVMSVAVCFVAVSAMPAFAKKNGAAHAKGQPMAEGTKVEDKTLKGSDNRPQWTQSDIKLFCKGREQTLHQDRIQCENSHKADLGHEMTNADIQELKSYHKSGLGKGIKKGATKGAKHAKKKGAGHAAKKSASGSGGGAAEDKKDHTIVQPPLPSKQ